MECLLTKLKGVVKDSSLLTLNEARLTIYNSDDENASFNIKSKNSALIKALDGGEISLQQNSGYSHSVSIEASVSTAIYIKPGYTTISIPNKLDIQNISFNSGSLAFTDFNIETFKYFTSLNELSISIDDKSYGNLEDTFSNKDMNLIVMSCKEGNANLTGDISFLDNVPQKTLQAVSNNKLVGEWKKVTNYAICSESNVVLNVISENDIDATCRMFVFAGNVTSFNLDWVSKMNTIPQFNGTDRIVNLIGNICNKLNGKSGSNVLLYGAIGTDIQTLSDLPNNITFFSTKKTNGVDPSSILPVSWTGNTNDRSNMLGLEDCHFKTGTAQFIKEMSSLSKGNITAFSIILAEDLTSSAAASDSALQSAISTLQEKGVTVRIGYANVAKNSITLMNALDIDVPKYGIVYKGKELIVGPADTSKTLIAPANDCLYQEFDTYEEAKAYVDAHGLEYRQSE